MTELGDIFAELGISQYLHDFVDQGFDTWETILDITESDFDVLGVKLGHRRKLQRKIANSRGLSTDRALGSPSNTPSVDVKAADQNLSSTKSEPKESVPHGAKRKYRRHPKPDDSAPERPPSAYVIFSNKMREDLKGRNLSFTEIAKLVGENWQNLAPLEKEPFEQQAFFAKERYNNELTEYKKTVQYRDYALYLADFKTKQANQQQVSEADAAKRPKLEGKLSAASTATASSGVSTHNDPVTGRARVESSASNTGQWTVHESQPSPQLTGMNTLNAGIPRQISPLNSTSPSVPPGYRDSILKSPPQTLAWRDGHRDEKFMPGSHPQQMPVVLTTRQSSHTSPQVGDPFGTMRHFRTQAHGPPPPLPSSESTAGRSTASGASTNSSIFYSPRTPLDPPFDRALPNPSMFSQKPNSGFDSSNQLPPLRPPSLSPSPSLLGSQVSPNGTLPNRIHAIVDYSGPMRNFAAPGTQPVGNSESRPRDYFPPMSSEEPLDPIVALLKAGEIVSSRSRSAS